MLSAPTLPVNMKTKVLLESVLPKPKSLDEIFISPNHEFIHQFDLGYVEKAVEL